MKRLLGVQWVGLFLLAAVIAACAQPLDEINHEETVGDARSEFPVLATPLPEYAAFATAGLPPPIDLLEMAFQTTPPSDLLAFLRGEFTPEPTRTPIPPLSEDGPWLLFCNTGEFLEIRNTDGGGRQSTMVKCDRQTYIAGQAGLAVNDRWVIQFPSGQVFRSPIEEPFVWSEDGAVHLYLPKDDASPLKVYDVAADRVREIASSPHLIIPRGISPNGEWVVYVLCEACATRDQAASLHAVTSHGESPLDVYDLDTGYSSVDGVLGWPSTSTLLTLRPAEFCDTHIFQIDLNPKRVTEIFGVHRHAAFDPEGLLILLEPAGENRCGPENWEPALVVLSAGSDWKPKPVSLSKDLQEYSIRDVEWLPELGQFGIWLTSEIGSRLLTMARSGEIVHEFSVQGGGSLGFGELYPSPDGQYMVVSGPPPFGARLFNERGDLIKKFDPQRTGNSPRVVGLQWLPGADAFVVMLTNGPRALYRSERADGWELETIIAEMADEPALALVSKPERPHSLACPFTSWEYTWLKVGDRVALSQEPPLSSRIRTLPELDATVLGVLEPGDEAEIMDGPHCGDDFVWWRLRTEGDGPLGWVAEGDDEGAWLVPVK